MKESTKFRELLGNTPHVRVLEYLIEGRELDHSLTDIAEGADINRITLYRLWPSIEKAKIILHSRNVGNAKLYKINLSNHQIKKLIELFDNTINEGIKKRIPAE